MKRAWVPAACVGVAFVVSSVLFRLNGGFGGGHGRYDLVIGCMALPWIMLESLLPDSLRPASDYSLFITLPFTLDLFLIYASLFAIRRFREGRYQSS